MSLIKWEPFGEMDRFFEDFNKFPMLSNTSNVGLDMAIDIYEEGKNIIAEMNVPGMDGDDIDVSVEDSHLRVSGSHSEEKEDKQKHYYSKEIRKGSFERIVRLPHPVDSEAVEAEYKKGVLKVSMPKKDVTPENKVKVVVKD